MKNSTVLQVSNLTNYNFGLMNLVIIELFTSKLDICRVLKSTLDLIGISTLLIGMFTFGTLY